VAIQNVLVSIFTLCVRHGLGAAGAGAVHPKRPMDATIPIANTRIASAACHPPKRPTGAHSASDRHARLWLNITSERCRITIFRHIATKGGLWGFLMARTSLSLERDTPCLRVGSRKSICRHIGARLRSHRNERQPNDQLSQATEEELAEAERIAIRGRIAAADSCIRCGAMGDGLLHDMSSHFQLHHA
jgi:hypothetical protein